MFTYEFVLSDRGRGIEIYLLRSAVFELVIEEQNRIVGMLHLLLCDSPIW